MNKLDFPEEFLIEIGELSPYLVGRVIVYQNQSLYDTEIDIILSESGKIYKHIGQVFSETSSKDALDLSYRKLKIFLHK